MSFTYGSFCGLRQKGPVCFCLRGFGRRVQEPGAMDIKSQFFMPRSGPRIHKPATKPPLDVQSPEVNPEDTINLTRKRVSLSGVCLFCTETPLLWVIPITKNPCTRFC